MMRELTAFLFVFLIAARAYGSELTAQWFCPQESYNIQQLTNEANVRVRIDAAGHVYLSPDIFRTKGMAITFGGNSFVVDYDECIASFLEDARKRAEAYKASVCDQSEEQLCRLPAPEIVEKLKQRIESSNYFETRKNFTKIPALPVGSSAIELSAEDAKAMLKDFCDGRPVRTRLLLSASVSSRLEESGSDADCARRYLQQAQAQQRRDETQLCGLSEQRFCRIARQKADDTISPGKRFADRLNPSTPSTSGQTEVPTTSAIPSELENVLATKFEQQLKAGEANISGGTITHEGKRYRVSDLDNAINQRGTDWMNEMSATQRRQFLQNYLVDKAPQIRRDEQVLKRCGDNPQGPGCGEAQARRSQVLDNTGKMFEGIYGNKGQRLVEELLECRTEDSEDALAELLKNLGKTNEVAKCMDLRPGDHRVFNHQRNDDKKFYETGDYLLKRDESGKYQAVLNLEFSNDGGRVSSQDMLNRARNCMQTINPYLKGPNGESLEISILTPTQVQSLPSNQRPNKREIKIKPSNFGTNASNYADSVDCPTIAHEVMHLFGLCDEYEETRSPLKEKWNCRVATKAPSLMRNHQQAFDLAIPRNLNCHCGDEPCRSVRQSTKPNAMKLYTRKSFFDVTDQSFRNKFCEPVQSLEPMELDSLPAGDRGVVLSSDQGARFVIESRRIGQDFPKVQRQQITCNCRGNDSECWNGKLAILSEARTGSQRSSCPAGASPLADQAAANPQNTLKLTTTPSMPSLLQPNQFEKILAGDCPTKAQDYQDCAGLAYLSKNDPRCKQLEKCHNDKVFLGIRQ
jgi:hypothetical protein